MGKRAWLLGLAAGLALAVVPAVRAAALTIDNGLGPPNPANVLDSEVTEPVEVRDVGCDTPIGVLCSVAGSPTTVEVAAGADLDSVDLRDTSLVRVTGGQMHNLWVDDSARATLQAGEITSDVVVRGSAQLIASGTATTAALFAEESGAVHWRDGQVGDVWGFGDGTVWISGGDVTGELFLHDSSRLQISGGSFAGFPDLVLAQQSRAVLSGGTFQALGLQVVDDAVLTVVGSGFTLDGDPVGYGLLPDGFLLQGTLSDGSPLDEAYVIGNGRIYLSAIPEPPVLLLLAVGGLWVAAEALGRGPARS